MELDILKAFLIGGQFLLFVFVLVILYRTYREKRLLTHQLTHTSSMLFQLKQNNENLLKELETLKDFQKNLKEAELTTRLQKPRLNEAITRIAPDAPERYQYISSLDQKGMGPAEIASILKISIQETEQLLSLLRIAQKN